MQTSTLKRMSVVTIALMLTAAGQPSASARRAAPDPLGRVKVSTVPFDPALAVESATYTPSGKVLVSFARKGVADPRDLELALVNDDGTGMRSFFRQRLPERPKDNGIRFMVFPDNKRIFLGDFIIECAASLDDCTQPALYPVDYPAEVASGDHIAHRWSEMIVAPDNRHVAWTTLLSNYAAIVFVGELRKQGDRYKIAASQIVSTLDPFAKDPRHADGVLPQPVRGGEVKQFVGGGSAISMVGAIRRDTPDSVVQHLGTGRLEAITDTPGYTETTIFSPDEQLGITMTTRFSADTDPAILGLMPRPYPTSLNMGLSMFAYTYAVTGVRRDRLGNVGPALIDIAASRKGAGYLGTNLNTQPDWVYHSPMSWHPDGTKAMWIEGQRGEGGARRIQVVKVLDYKPKRTVVARPWPMQIPGATADLSLVAKQAATSRDIDVTVHGKVSGTIHYRRSPDGITQKTYTNFSDGEGVYSGMERLQANPQGRSTYRAQVRLTGKQSGSMDLQITFGPLGGKLPAQIVFDKDAQGVPLSHGQVEYAGKRLDVRTLRP